MNFSPINFFHKLTKSSNFWPLLAIIVLGVMASRTLIFQRGYFNMHDDLQMMRQLELEKCILDGQFPCRWVPDMGYGYGFPLFNFYPPLPYIIGEFFRLIGFSFTETVKLTFALSIISSGLAMYFFTKQFFGKYGGVIAASFYIWAPYHAVDIYVRGAMNEAWALVWFPLILLTSYKLLIENKHQSRWIIALGLSWAGLMLSHNLMVMIFAPVFICWCFIFWIGNRDIKKAMQLMYAGLLAFGLAAFFTLPAIVEQSLVHVDMITSGYYNYIVHFAAIGQLLTSRYWGYGPSTWGLEDKMPFQIGHFHWILSIFLSIFAVYNLINKKRRAKIGVTVLTVVLFSASFGWFAAFMAHQYSTPIWLHLKPLEFVQFPWRFLTLVIFGFSTVAGATILVVPRKFSLIFAVVLITLLVIFNWNYFLPENGRMGPLTDAQKFAGKAWELQRTAGIFDYLPKTARLNPKDPPYTLAEFHKGTGVVTNAQQGTNWAEFNVDVYSPSTLRIGLFQFPNWKIELNGERVSAYVPEDEDFGRMYLDVPEGSYNLSFKLVDTPVRTFSNLVSSISWFGLVLYLLRKKIVLPA